MGFRRQRFSANTVAAILIGGLTPSSAIACAFHGYEPQPTLVERMISADHVVLARPAEENAFRYEVTDALQSTGTSVVLPMLVDSSTRRLLRQQPNAQVLFARDADTEVWHRLITVDASFAPILKTIQDRLPEWEQAPKMRASYFASHLNHSDTRIRTLALRELDLADYGTLKALNLDVDAKALQSQLDAITEMDLRAIRILLMGLAPATPELSTFMRFRLTQGLAHESEMLGAYALSLIELEGVGGIHWLDATLITSPQNTYGTRSALVQALAMHFETGDAELRRTISDVLSARVVFDPGLAYVVSLQFSAIAANAGLEIPDTDIDADQALEALQALEISKSIPLRM